jgi:hypothetical protein
MNYNNIQRPKPFRTLKKRKGLRKWGRFVEWGDDKK